MRDGDPAEADHHVRPELPRDLPQPVIALQQLRRQPQPPLSRRGDRPMLDAELVEQRDQHVLVAADHADLCAFGLELADRVVEDERIRRVNQVEEDAQPPKFIR